MNRRKLTAMRARLIELEKAAGGVLTPEAVVSDARKKTSVLHSMFEWNDKKAAHQHRLDQARELIASVRYVYEVEEIKYSAPRYVRDPNAESSAQGYVSMPRLLSDKDLAREALLGEFSRAASHLARAHEIAKALSFAPAEVEAIKNSVGVLLQRVSQFDTDPPDARQ